MPILAFCCRYYGWTMPECLALPIKSIMAFHREGKRLQAVEHLESLRISAVPIMSLEYFNFMKEHYSAIIDPKILELPPKPYKLPKEAPDLSKAETQNRLINMFAKGKRGRGYGR